MQKIYGDFLAGRAGIGLLILRLVVGGALLQHGYGKMFGAAGPFGWMGPKAAMPGILQFLAALSEFGGGLALIVGLLTPLAALGIAFTMGVAILTAHKGQPWVSMDPKAHPFESALFYLAAALTLIFTGPGSYSLDAMLWGGNRRVSQERLNRASEVTNV